MSIIDRITRVTSARVQAFLSASDHPEEVLPELIQEMKQQGRQTAKAVATALAAVRSAQRKLDEAEGRIRRLEKGAELALAQQDEPLAREALAGAVQASQAKDRACAALTQAQQALEQARQAQGMITDRLQELQTRADHLTKRSAAMRSKQEVGRRTGSSGASLLDSIAAIEVDLDREEAEIELHRSAVPGSRCSLEERLKALELQSEIERRMDGLRKSHQRPSKDEQR
jgi:phage shock protein A